MIGGIILTHGPIGKATIEAAETILGKTDNIIGVSTMGHSLKGLVEKLKEIIADKNWSDGIIILVSLKGGTCWNAAAAISREFPKIKIVSGVNLAMAISFLTKRNKLELADLAATIFDDGIRGIEKY